jgi:hypothetical protein
MDCYLVFHVGKPVFTLIVTAGILLAARCAEARAPGDDHFFTGVSVSWHKRLGQIDFGEGRIEYSEPARLQTVGLTIGKNFPLPFNLRLALPLILETGSVRDDSFEEVPLNNGSVHDLILYSKMYHAGLQPILRIPFRLNSGVWPCLSAGAGVHYVAFVEQLLPADGTDLLVEDPYLEESRNIVASGAAGAGINIVINNRFIVFLQYLFRYWRPVKRKTARDLFPLDAQSYSERFLSHMVSIAVMVPRRGD